jgi:hypothetical protein
LRLKSHEVIYVEVWVLESHEVFKRKSGCQKAKRLSEGNLWFVSKKFIPGILAVKKSEGH